ncbi:hypothetical protein Plhal304r1_c058g0144821 [Plasmopara halstedii]
MYIFCLSSHKHASGYTGIVDFSNRLSKIAHQNTASDDVNAAKLFLDKVTANMAGRRPFFQINFRDSYRDFG